MAVFSDADVREYLEAQIHRRCTSLEIDDELVTVVKGTSGGVPLAVEMATDVLCALDRSAFLRDFALRDETLLPGDRLAQVTARFLRYCLVAERHLPTDAALDHLKKALEQAPGNHLWARCDPDLSPSTRIHTSGNWWGNPQSEGPCPRQRFRLIGVE